MRSKSVSERFISCMCALSCGLTFAVFYDALLHLQPGHRVPRFSAIHWALCVPASCNASDVQVALSDTLQRHTEGTGVGFRSRPPRVGVSRVHKIKTHTRARARAKAVTYAAHNEHKKRKSMLSTGFEPAIPTIKKLQAFALHRTAKRISYHVAYCY